MKTFIPAGRGFAVAAVAVLMLGGGLAERAFAQDTTANEDRANAGADQSVNAGDPVTLSGTFIDPRFMA